MSDDLTARLEALAATYDYADPAARACADLPIEKRTTYAFGALSAAIEEYSTFPLAVLAHELRIACCFDVTG